jgi:hypothetical protein
MLKSVSAAHMDAFMEPLERQYGREAFVSLPLLHTSTGKELSVPTLLHKRLQECAIA